MKFYIHTGGGLGDMLKHYFWGRYGWRYAKSVKEKYPQAEIKLITTCCNPTGHDVFKYFPHIDVIEPHTWVDPNRAWKGLDKHIRGYQNLALAPKILKQQNLASAPPPKVYLGDEDDKELLAYKPKEDFIVMHPFAGDKIRMDWPVEDFASIAKLIAKELGYEVLVLGGRSDRVIGAASRTINEKFPYKAPGVMNLVDKISIRTACALAQDAYHFIGANSCFYCIRLATKSTASLLFRNHVKFTQGKPLRLRKDGISYAITRHNKQLRIDKEG
jgi:ADP-heptose:LPS heptosyltransferase